MNEYVTQKEISEQTGLSRAQLYRWIHRGLLPTPERRARQGSRGQPASVWPIGVIARIKSIFALLEANTPLDRVPKWLDERRR